MQEQAAQQTAQVEACVRILEGVRCVAGATVPDTQGATQIETDEEMAEHGDLAEATQAGHGRTQEERTEKRGSAAGLESPDIGGAVRTLRGEQPEAILAAIEDDATRDALGALLAGLAAGMEVQAPSKRPRNTV